MRASIMVLAATVALAAAKGTFSSYWGEYDTRGKGPNGGPTDKDGVINVHILPHTHDDTGWLITVDQYYVQDVNFILDTVTQQLLANPDRKFMYVETGFFERWWIQQSAQTKALFTDLVAQGQLEFVNGGWCMHDEASPNYHEMVENTARGHQFLKRYFGIAPKGTWQIDPFGHTNTQAWLIGQYAGLQYLFFGRMDYADFNMRKNLSSMVAPNVPRSIEWVWQGSKTFGNQYQTFTGELYGGGGGGYGPPNNMYFDGNDNMVQDDPRIHDYNLDAFVTNVVNDVLDQAQHTRTQHIVWAMGSDFNYQNADHWYLNLDKIIYHVNRLRPDINMFYSTPTIYTAAKFNSNLTWEARYDDVMPLADNSHHYWTGYFTSRQSLKKYLRVMNNVLQAARQLALMVETATCTSRTYTQTVCTDNLEEAITVTTHHDGLSGTEKQAVADDYALRIAFGEQETRGMLVEAFTKLTGLNNVQFCYGTPSLNISFCPFTTSTNAFTVVAYNSLGFTAPQTLRIPIAGGSATVVRAADGSPVPAQIVPISALEKGLSLSYLSFPEYSNATRKAQFTNNATNVLVFTATLPAVGYETYKVTVSAHAPPANAMVVVNGQAHQSTKLETKASLTTIQNDYYQVTLDPAVGSVVQIMNIKTRATAAVNIDVGFYNSSLGGCTFSLPEKQKDMRWRREQYEFGMDPPNFPNAPGYGCDDQHSGAYIFRPNSSQVWPAACTMGNCWTKPTFTVTTGPVVQEATITYADWATVVVRLVMGQPRVEVEYTVGPIPQANFEGGTAYLQGKEVVLRYNTSLQTNGTWYTDSNGRELVQRQYNLRGPAYPNPYPISEPSAGNYYPVNAMMALEDTTNNLGLSVVVDRSLGGASLANGELEFMVHRRTEADDGRGVDEAMNETMCGCRGDGDPSHCQCVGLIIKGTQYLLLDNIDNVNQNRRIQHELLNYDPVIAFGTGNPTIPNVQGLGKDLPPNVKLLTFGVPSPQYQDRVYLRLSHLFQADEHPQWSQPVNVSLRDYFTKQGLTIVAATETSLTGNQTPEQVAAQAYKWNVVGEKEQMPPVKQKVGGMIPFDPKDPSLTVNLRPMDIRTFEVTLE